MTISAVPAVPGHIRKLRQIRCSAWLAILLSLPFHVIAAPVASAAASTLPQADRLEHHP